MPTRINPSTEDQQLRNALDWAVFTLGALSLTIAITATILGSGAELSADSAAAAEPATG